MGNMAKMTIGERAGRSLQFLMGLREPAVYAALEAHGFTSADRDQGFELLRGLTDSKLSVTPVPARDASSLDRLDAWENLWFPIADATLRARFPSVHATVFLNLRQSEGAEVVISVGTMLDRLDALRASGSKEATDAIALLATRGLDAARIAEGRGLLDAANAPVQRATSNGGIDPETIAAREAALWTWYLEWSQIARAAIHDRRQLRLLGFGQKRASSEPESPESAVS